MKLKKRYLIPLIIIVALALLYLLGPKAKYPAFDGKISDLNLNISQLDDFLSQKESKIPDMKKDNEARIVWADSSKQKTEYSVVYIHGFSASAMEGDPVHFEFANRFGTNLYLHRLPAHGRKDSVFFRDLTPKKLIDSAKEAISIGKILGDKVIVMSCSTGSTLSAYLAAYNPDDIHAQIMYSPNINLKSKMSTLLTKPWGMQLIKMLEGENHSFEPPDDAEKYWNCSYPVESLVALRSLIDQTMKPEIFKKITVPTWFGYYYKNEKEQDPTISVAAIDKMYDQISTPVEMKRKVPFPKAKVHVITSKLYSQDLDTVILESYKYAEEVLGMEVSVK